MEAFWAVRTTPSKVDRTFDVTGTVHWGLGGGAGRGQVLMAAVTCIGPQLKGAAQCAAQVGALEKSLGEHAGGEIRADEGKRE